MDKAPFILFGAIIAIIAILYVVYLAPSIDGMSDDCEGDGRAVCANVTSCQELGPEYIGIYASCRGHGRCCLRNPDE